MSANMFVCVCGPTSIELRILSKYIENLHVHGGSILKLLGLVLS